MRDKHVHIAEDSQLLKLIYRQVEEKLQINQRRFSWMLWIKFIVYFSCAVIAYSLLYITDHPLYFIMSFVGYGFASLLFSFNFSHDFSHNTIFKSKRLNHICFVAIYTMVGAHAEAWKQRHINSHHYAPNVEGYDSDLKITRLIRVVPGADYYWFHRFQHFYAPVMYTTYSLFWVFIKDFVILYSSEEGNTNKGFHYHLLFWIQKSIYIAIVLVLPILYSGQSMYAVLAGFILMHMTQSLFLLFTFFMTHHVETTTYPATDENGYINTSWLMNQVRSSNDMHPFSKTANFILGGFNNHIAHHLFPHIHHIHYPILSRILYDVLIENSITPNQTSYWGGIVSHVKLLKRMSQTSDHIVPEPAITG